MGSSNEELLPLPARKYQLRPSGGWDSHLHLAVTGRFLTWLSMGAEWGLLILDPQLGVMRWCPTPPSLAGVVSEGTS